jgi:prevent-host-death family protein
MNQRLAMTEVRPVLGRLIRQAAHARDRVTITDHGQPAAVLISAAELEDLEDALALARYQLAQLTGTQVPPVPHETVRERLGFTE